MSLSASSQPYTQLYLLLLKHSIYKPIRTTLPTHKRKVPIPKTATPSDHTNPHTLYSVDLKYKKDKRLHQALSPLYITARK